jgi:hypothetical protein
VSGADLIAWMMLALLIGWIGFVLWCTYVNTVDDLRRAGALRGRPRGRRWDDRRGG